MEELTHEKITRVMRESGVDEGIIDDDLIMLMDDLNIGAEKLKMMLMSFGVEESKATIMIKKITEIIFNHDLVEY